MMTNDITQEQLNGLVPLGKLKALLGVTSEKEKRAATGGVLPRTYLVVSADKIRDIRTVEPTADEGAYLTLETARGVLPPTYGPRMIDGVEYGARFSIPTLEIKGYTPDQIVTFRQRLADYRQRVEAERVALSESRKALFQRFLDGDPNVELRIFETTPAVPDPTGGNRVGDSQFGRVKYTRNGALQTQIPVPGTERYDPASGRWIREDDGNERVESQELTELAP